MPWEKYYQVVYFNEVAGRDIDGEVILKPIWFIAYSDECGDNRGRRAYHVNFRTEKHARRSAQRLYWREHGAMEEALGINGQGDSFIQEEN